MCKKCPICKPCDMASEDSPKPRMCHKCYRGSMAQFWKSARVILLMSIPLMLMMKYVDTIVYEPILLWSACWYSMGYLLCAFELETQELYADPKQWESSWGNALTFVACSSTWPIIFGPKWFSVIYSKLFS